MSIITIKLPYVPTLKGTKDEYRNPLEPYKFPYKVVDNINNRLNSLANTTGVVYAGLNVHKELWVNEVGNARIWEIMKIVSEEIESLWSSFLNSQDLCVAEINKTDSQFGN